MNFKHLLVLLALFVDRCRCLSSRNSSHYTGLISAILAALIILLCSILIIYVIKKRKQKFRNQHQGSLPRQHTYQEPSTYAIEMQHYTRGTPLMTVIRPRVYTVSSTENSISMPTTLSSTILPPPYSTISSTDTSLSAPTSSIYTESPPPYSET